MVLIFLCRSLVYLILTAVTWLRLTVSLFHPIAIEKLSQVQELVAIQEGSRAVGVSLEEDQEDDQKLGAFLL